VVFEDFQEGRKFRLMRQDTKKRICLSTKREDHIHKTQKGEKEVEKIERRKRSVVLFSF